MLQERLELSERRACRIVGQHRSAQRREVTRGQGDDALRARLHSFSRKHKRWGYRKAHEVLKDEGWGANRKKIQRLWREESLKVPQRKRKRQRLGASTCPADRLRAERPDHVWALDFQFDQTADGRILKLLNIVDEHSREELGGLVERRIDADRRVSALDDIVAKKGETPEFIRCDNGPELTANRPARLVSLLGHGNELHRAGLAVGEPVRRVLRLASARRVAVARAVRHTARGAGLDRRLEARIQHYRPHSSLGWRSPVAYATAWKAENQVDRLS
jgi:putative transposase